jgi:hypothetical protein
MKKNDLLSLAQDPRFIPGIYNYCDRWCDRCSLPSRCLNHALELEPSGPMAHQDLPPGAFWEKFETALKEASELIVEMAQEQGLDLSRVEMEAAQRAKRPPTPQRFLLVKAAQDYEPMVDRWFESQTAAVQAKGEELLQQLRLGVAEPEREAAMIFDAVEVIRWYQPFIYAKLRRAIDQEPEAPARGTENPQSDANGSVKAALIALDRSLAAWAELHRHFPDKTDDLLPVLVHLDRLRRDAETAFPRARHFVRPGFDAA